MSLPAHFSAADLRRILKHEQHPALSQTTPARLVHSIVSDMRREGYVFTADREAGAFDETQKGPDA